MKRILPFTFALLGLLATMGCVVVPIPATGKKVISGSRVETNDVSFIQPGKTTRWELIQRLGPPGRFYNDLLVATYPWQTASLYVAWAIFVPDVGAGDVEAVAKTHLFLVQFDACDRVVRHEFVRQGRSASLRARATRWSGHPADSARELAVSRLTLPTAPPDESILCLYRTGQGLDAWRVRPRVLLDGKLFADLSSHRHDWIVLRPGLHTVSLEGKRNQGQTPFGILAELPSRQVELYPGRSHYVEVNVSEDARPPRVRINVRSESDVRSVLPRLLQLDSEY